MTNCLKKKERNIHGSKEHSEKKNNKKVEKRSYLNNPV